MRLIDADELQGEFEWLKSVVYYHEIDRVEDAVQRIKNAPTIEAEPVRHGKWKKGVWHTYPDGYVCDRCNTGYAIPYNYCPNCGAKMDLE